MAVDFGNLKADAGLSKLDDHMKTHSYVTGFVPTQDDAACVGKLLGCPNSAKYPNACRWFNHISKFSINEKNSWPKGSMKPEKAKKQEDDDFDLFGETTEADKEAAKKLAQDKKEQGEKKKKVVINKSSLVIEIKPADSDTNLDDVVKMVKEIAIEGVTWGESSKKVPVAFGLYKLQMSCVILDDIVNTNEITDRIEAIGMNEEQKEKLRQRQEGEDEDDDEEDVYGLVQSAEIVSFNKL